MPYSLQMSVSTFVLFCLLFFIIFIWVGIYTGVSISTFTVSHMGKDMEVMLIRIALLTQKNVSMAQQIYFCPPLCNYSEHVFLLKIAIYSYNLASKSCLCYELQILTFWVFLIFCILNIPSEISFDSWVAWKSVIKFPNIWEFSVLHSVDF